MFSNQVFTNFAGEIVDQYRQIETHDEVKDKDEIKVVLNNENNKKMTGECRSFKL